MASVFVLLEAFNRKEAAALGFFPCATASFFAKIKDCDRDNIKSRTDIPRYGKVMNGNYIQKITLQLTFWSNNKLQISE